MDKMKIKITGSSGYLGRAISKKLKKYGHVVSGIEREVLYKVDKLQEAIQGTNAIINLAGAPILQRWTSENRKIIYDSRVKTTQNLVKAINSLPLEKRPEKFISASAIGIYDPGKTHDESSIEFEQGFVGKVVLDWEKAVEPLTDDIQKIIFRIAPVLGKKSETIKNLKLPFKLGLGGKIGDGKQPFPFVHEQDVTDAILWGIEDYRQSGIFNLSAPEQISNNTFTKTFASKLKRPAIIPVPAFALKILYGETAQMLVKSPGVIPKELQKAGYNFKYPDIDSALSEILT